MSCQPPLHIFSATHLSYFHVFCFIRYCIDNGGMIAQAGIFAYQMNMVTPLEEATCTQRYVVLCSAVLCYGLHIVSIFCGMLRGAIATFLEVLEDIHVHSTYPLSHFCTDFARTPWILYGDIPKFML